MTKGCLLAKFVMRCYRDGDLKGEKLETQDRETDSRNFYSCVANRIEFFTAMDLLLLLYSCTVMWYLL